MIDIKCQQIDAEISVAEELIVVLKSFHDATEIISGEKYPTIGIVKPLLKKLEVTLATREMIAV